jgi:predicted CopG family antitoxin
MNEAAVAKLSFCDIIGFLGLRKTSRNLIMRYFGLYSKRDLKECTHAQRHVRCVEVSSLLAAAGRVQSMSRRMPSSGM